ncbi:hypothetical protein [Entomomonas asaccharolytica]|uniref:Lipoprotein n=1 Tax=Entomomonas asaccharolytica TaxID=2785331 RepID=A0A974ND98_9GAMM|nr:hypothetical protein [Entomomonas asaccharolytica]QQP84641.1 hypothetical protein JHT90_09490 [Entomomonas asaccharolytica]
MKKLSRIFAVCFLLVGCISKVTITPDKLPEAKLEQPYYAKIEIKGGSGPVSAGGLSYSITPIDSGIELDVCDPEDKTFFTYNCFIVKGIPKILHNITLTIKGDMVGTMYMGSSEFDKTYVIKVKDAD